ncbi:diacylglycerol kinase, partial [Micromonospora sp. U56]
MDGGEQTRPVTADDAPPRSAVVVNPSKVTDLDQFRRTVDDALAAAGWPEPTWYETTVEDPGRGQTEAAVAAGAQVVFACGGDGTVMACVSGLVGTDAALAVLPQGTGNLLAANLGLSNDLAAGLQVAVERG